MGSLDEKHVSRAQVSFKVLLTCIDEIHQQCEQLETPPESDENIRTKDQCFTLLPALRTKKTVK